MPARNELFKEAGQHNTYVVANAAGMIEEPRQLEIAVNPADHGGANLLCVYTGGNRF